MRELDYTGGSIHSRFGFGEEQQMERIVAPWTTGASTYWGKRPGYEVGVDRRVVALAMAEGPASGLSINEDLLRQGGLDSYHLVHAAHADLSQRLGFDEQAIRSYRRALSLATNQSEVRLMDQRLRALESL